MIAEKMGGWATWVKVSGKLQASGYGISDTGNIINGIVIALYGDRCYTCREHSIIYRLVESLACTPASNVTCVNNSSLKHNKIKQNTGKA